MLQCLSGVPTTYLARVRWGTVLYLAQVPSPRRGWASPTPASLSRAASTSAQLSQLFPLSFPPPPIRTTSRLISANRPSIPRITKAATASLREHHCRPSARARPHLSSYRKGRGSYSSSERKTPSHEHVSRQPRAVDSRRISPQLCTPHAQPRHQASIDLSNTHCRLWRTASCLAQNNNNPPPPVQAPRRDLQLSPCRCIPIEAWAQVRRQRTNLAWRSFSTRSATSSAPRPEPPRPTSTRVRLSAQATILSRRCSDRANPWAVQAQLSEMQHVREKVFNMEQLHLNIKSKYVPYLSIHPSSRPHPGVVHAVPC